MHACLRLTARITFGIEFELNYAQSIDVLDIF